MKIKSAGFTLVELMVALVIGLLLIFAAGQLYLMSKKNFDSMKYLSERQESLLYLTELLSTDVRTSEALRIYSSEGEDEASWLTCREGHSGDVEDSILWLLYGRSIGGQLPGAQTSVRSSDPYCPDGSERRSLYAVSYYFDSEENDIMACYSCEDDSESGESVVYQRLGLQGVKSVNFKELNSDDDELVRRAGVRIEIEYDGGGVGGALDKTFPLHVIRRSALLEGPLEDN